MDATRNRAAIRQAVERLNAGDLEGYLALYDEACVLHGYPPGLPPGAAGARVFYRQAIDAFPDVRLTLDDEIWEGERAAIRYTTRGTHSAPFLGVPATGRRVVFTGITILRMRDGRCVERWNQMDALGLLQQLGAAPVPEARPA